MGSTKNRAEYTAIVDAWSKSTFGRLEETEFESSGVPIKYASLKRTCEFAEAAAVGEQFAAAACEAGGYLTLHTSIGKAEFSIAISRPVDAQDRPDAKPGKCFACGHTHEAGASA